MLTPLTKLAAGEERKATTLPSSEGSAKRPSGTVLNQAFSTSSSLIPFCSESVFFNSVRRYVLVNPGRTLFIVIEGGNSLDNVLDQEAIAPRIVLLTPKPGIGSFTEVEIILTIRP